MNNPLVNAVETAGLDDAVIAEFRRDVEELARLPGLPDPYRQRPWLEKRRAEWLQNNPQ